MDRISYSIPSSIADEAEVSNIYRNYNARGEASSYGVDIELAELHYFKTLKSTVQSVLVTKLEGALEALGEKYNRHLDKLHTEISLEEVENRNRELEDQLLTIENLLHHTLTIDDTVDWDKLIRSEQFSTSPASLFNATKKPGYVSTDSNGKPSKWRALEQPTRPSTEPNLDKIAARFGFLTRQFGKSKIERAYQEEVDNHNQQVKSYHRQIKETKEQNLKRKEEFDEGVARYHKLEADFLKEQEKANKAVHEMRGKYESGDASAIEEYCDLVLTNSEYPDYFPQSWQLQYREAERMIIVQYDLPTPSQLPAIISYKYVKTRDSIDSKKMAKSVVKTQFEFVIHQIALRTIHELFEADAVIALDTVVFNGVITDKNPATGIMESKIIASVSAEKSKFLELNLSEVVPKAAFKHLKGVSAASLIDLSPIPPIIQLDKSDRRIVEGQEVVSKLDNSVNLAAMDWEDFEHLIRELFEEEFVTSGGEVKVTQASSDGGVDAIAFDPDPIRGGKIVIQAKRYTNVVGVSAVRDLYGTVLNEGATKGILVTTSNYGKDSYEFAKDKPLTLLNGENLLSMLEKHGHKARINIAEAKILLAE